MNQELEDSHALIYSIMAELGVEHSELIILRLKGLRESGFRMEQMEA